MKRQSYSKENNKSTTYILTRLTDDEDDMGGSKNSVSVMWLLSELSDDSDKCFNNKRRGILYTLIGAFFSATASVAIKISEEVVPVAQVLWFKFIVMFVLVSGSLIIRREQIHSDGKLLVLFVRSCFENVAMSLVLFAVMFLPVGEATVVMFFSMSLFMVLMAAIFLKEPITWKIYVALVLGMCGVFLLANPEEIIFDRSFSKFKLYGLAAGVGHGIFRASSSIIIRKIGSAIESQVVIFYHSVYGLTIFSLIIVGGYITGFLTKNENLSSMFFVRVTDSLLLAICISIGILMFCCQSFATKGTQICDSSIVATVRNFSIVFGFVYQVLVFGEVPNVFAIIGTLLIMAAIGLIISDK